MPRRSLIRTSTAPRAEGPNRWPGAAASAMIAHAANCRAAKVDANGFTRRGAYPGRALLRGARARGGRRRGVGALVRRVEVVAPVLLDVVEGAVGALHDLAQDVRGLGRVVARREHGDADRDGHLEAGLHLRPVARAERPHDAVGEVAPVVGLG